MTNGMSRTTMHMSLTVAPYMQQLNTHSVSYFKKEVTSTTSMLRIKAPSVQGGPKK